MVDETAHGLRQYRHGCRCDVCRKASADDRRAYRHNTHAPREYVHGTKQGYNRGCRCESCTVANTEKQRNAKQRRLQRLATASFKHGRSGYKNWNCRCLICSDAHRKEMKARRLRIRSRVSREA